MEFEEQNGYIDADGDFQSYGEDYFPDDAMGDNNDALSEDLTEEPELDGAETEDTGYEDEGEEDTESEEELAEEEAESEEEEQDDFQYPDFIDESLIVPQEFKSERSELNWYRENYRNAINVYAKPEFQESLLSTYKDYLLSQEQDVEELKAVKSVFEGNPELALKVFGQEGLENRGISSRLTDEEIGEITDGEMRKQFGDNYISKYDKDELINPNSLSSKMLLKTQEISKAIQEHQEKANEFAEQTRPLTPEEIQDQIDEQYLDYFQDSMDIETFDSMVEDIKAGGPPDIMDLHKARYFDDYMKEAYRRGLEQGKKGIVGEIKKASKPLSPATPRQPKPSDQPFDIMASRRYKPINFY